MTDSASGVRPSHVRIGVQLWPGGTPDYRTWRQAVLHAEELGADAIFGYDHFHKPFVDIVDGVPHLHDEQPEVNNFEGWTALASWAEITSRAEIGLLVTGMPYRNPDLVADMARTVDHISGGRLILGVGAGWYWKDFTVYGYDYGSVRTRMDQFDEGLARIEHRLAHLTPGPVRHIPILIGGGGERRTIPIAARHADIWHSFEPIDEFRRKNDLLKQLASEAGRDEAAIERAIAWTDAAAADAFVDEGVTLFTTEIHPDGNGYDFSELETMLNWRDR
ncbi:LLM class F420-dependent oxidoreductase [Mycobacterium terramassiliense]|uniref:Flavin-dependent oxidoreductase, luciferase family (Includes alkanesulfonate monooxygenase SsuD and methylene tetrahydromethanopterin reductase) n=1 Tax=Mycobacterium terramassiliense TaxID=1841859 RepID=A0A2U3N5B3_9MYCO|nr:LLM class F420-dependent oxidoreductase [Mycobacterium terramassiliense]SPM26701.1 Flavin-dependent oxidoreductase, luciferase family (includes alkanesulfonate monooxygenase SsuD and methylene tetrahydromethanopterin reductase) [Mycobacterium terramassiliense]